jgi:ubiquitin C-terminal hydrolase
MPIDTPGAVGLQNLGNTCYMNSALQCLVRVKLLTQYLLSPNWRRDRNPTNPLGSGCRVVDAYSSLLADMTNGRPSSTSRLKDAVAAHIAIFRDSGEHDANEFLITLLDVIHEDLNQAETTRRNVPGLEQMSGMDFHRTCNKSVIVDIFHGERSNVLTFTPCRHYDDVREPLTSWALPLAPSRGSAVVTLRDCILTWEQDQEYADEAKGR